MIAAETVGTHSISSGVTSGPLKPWSCFGYTSKVSLRGRWSFLRGFLRWRDCHIANLLAAARNTCRDPGPCKGAPRESAKCPPVQCTDMQLFSVTNFWGVFQEEGLMLWHQKTRRKQEQKSKLAAGRNWVDNRSLGQAIICQGILPGIQASVPRPSCPSVTQFCLLDLTR